LTEDHRRNVEGITGENGGFVGEKSELPRSYHGGSKRKQRDLKEQKAECQPPKISKKELTQREISPTIDGANIDIYFEKTT
jgi:hypothetical protein